MKEARDGGRSEGEVKKLIREIYDIAPLLLKNTERPEAGQASYAFYNCTVVSWAAAVNDAELYKLACSAVANAEKYMTDDNRSHIAGSHQSLARMAISTSCDVAAARDHLEKWLKLYKPAGAGFDPERVRQTWPVEWETKPDVRPADQSEGTPDATGEESP